MTALVLLALAQAVTNGGIERGDPAAPVTVIEFADFGCRYCEEFALKTFPALDQEFIRTGRVRWVVVPFVLGSFRNSGDATAASLCAARQNAFWAMHDRIFERRREFLAARDPEPVLAGLAAELGLDSMRFRSCYRDRDTAARIREFNRLSREYGVRATPTFFVNGRRVEGALPLETFRELLAVASSRP